jgi:hypothetical protein
MIKITKLRTALAFVAAAGAAAAITLPTAFAGGAPHYSHDIYKLTVTSPDRTGAPFNMPEWVSLATGTWRVEFDHETYISSDGDYVVIDDETGSVYHRTGSPSFMANLHARPEGVLALQAYVHGDPALANQGFRMSAGKNAAGKTDLVVADAHGKRAFTVTIEGRVSDEDAAAAHLLDATPVRAQVTDTELAAGQPPQGDISGFWFGRDVGRLHAAAAAEHTRVRTPAEIAAGMSARSEGDVYLTLYERAGVQSTSAQPNTQVRPDGELQIESEPITSEHAQGLIAAFNGKNGDETYSAWPRSSIRLADGTVGTLVPSQFDGQGSVRSGFFVITDSTLISVSGDVAASDIPGRAGALRRIG